MFTRDYLHLHWNILYTYTFNKKIADAISISLIYHQVFLSLSLDRSFIVTITTFTWRHKFVTGTFQQKRDLWMNLIINQIHRIRSTLANGHRPSGYIILSQYIARTLHMQNASVHICIPFQSTYITYICIVTASAPNQCTRGRMFNRMQDVHDAIRP